MTSTALVKKADLRRLAAVAKEAGVSAWVEIDGKKFGVSPNIPDIHNPPAPVKKERIRL